MAEEIKRFGANERPKPRKFELQTLADDGASRVHSFSLVPIVPAGNVTALMEALENEPEKSFGLMIQLMARLLDNTDGTPAKWEAVEETDGKTKAWFVGPDNEPYDANDPQRAFWEDMANGSSRRRWNWLMDPSNEDEAVDLSDLVDIAKWVVSEAVDRPTTARSSSTRGSRKTKH